MGDTVKKTVTDNGDGTETVVTKTVTAVTPVTNSLQLLYHGWPSVCTAEENGTTYVFAVASGNRYRHVDPFGETWLYRGTVNQNGTVTWGDRIIINKNENYRDNRDAGITYLGNGQLVLTYFQQAIGIYKSTTNSSYYQWKESLTEEQVDHIYATWDAIPQEKQNAISFVRYSNDFGASWSEPQEVPVSTPHGVSLLANGDLLYVGRRSPASNTAADGIYAYKGVIARNGEGDITSIAWSLLSKLEYPEGYGYDGENGYSVLKFGEPHAVELANGRILCLTRAEGTGDETYVLPERFSMTSCYSDDGGKTWSQWKPLGFAGSPPHLMELAKDVVLLTYARRDTVKGVFYRISYDGGLTWSEETALSPASASGDMGYPMTALISRDGYTYQLVTVYYGYNTVTRVNSILYTTWTLSPVSNE